jgi:hypothetical protein
MDREVSESEEEEELSGNQAYAGDPAGLLQQVRTRGRSIHGPKELSLSATEQGCCSFAAHRHSPPL